MKGSKDEFRNRTNLPAASTREELEELGARYLRTDSFKDKETVKRLEQMQLKSGDSSYMWKRIVPEDDRTTIPFEIHLEITPTGYIIY